MVPKNSTQVLEQHSISPVATRDQTTISNLISIKDNLIPQALIEEIEDFTERNSIAIIAHTIPERKPIHRCCPQCLKAHIIKTAQELRLNRIVITNLIKSLTCETGHKNYYLDEEKLIQV
jgi:hypothetical protein